MTSGRCRRGTSRWLRSHPHPRRHQPHRREPRRQPGPRLSGTEPAIAGASLGASTATPSARVSRFLLRSDFEGIVAKRDAAALLRRTIDRPSGAATDHVLGVCRPVPTIEARLGITPVSRDDARSRPAALDHPASLVLRDLDRSPPSMSAKLIHVAISVTTSATPWPRRWSPGRRPLCPARSDLETLRAGHPRIVMMAPIIPRRDHEIPAAQGRIRSRHGSGIRAPPVATQIKDLFLRMARPALSGSGSASVRSRIRDGGCTTPGSSNDSDGGRGPVISNPSVCSNVASVWTAPCRPRAADPPQRPGSTCLVDEVAAVERARRPAVRPRYPTSRGSPSPAARSLSHAYPSQSSAALLGAAFRRGSAAPAGRRAPTATNHRARGRRAPLRHAIVASRWRHGRAVAEQACEPDRWRTPGDGHRARKSAPALSRIEDLGLRADP